MTEEEALNQLLGTEPQQGQEAGLPGSPPVWIELVSSDLAAVIYWGTTGPDGASLGVRFHKNHREYHYWGVPESTFHALLNAQSHGTTFRALVRASPYPYRPYPSTWTDPSELTDYQP